MALGIFEYGRLLFGASSLVEIVRDKIGLYGFQFGHFHDAIRHDSISLGISVVSTSPSQGLLAGLEPRILFAIRQPPSHDGLFESQSGWSAESIRMVVLVRTECIVCYWHALAVVSLISSPPFLSSLFV